MKPSLKDLLTVAMKPVGNTLYVWGGGWNLGDTGAGEDGCRIGVNPAWKEFFLSEDETYDYRENRFAYGKGLDCSGYIGWVLYNLWEKKSNNSGYVYPAGEMALQCAANGWGIYREEAKSYFPGDIMSGKTHVYLVIGRCPDGSVILVHSSPQGGVQLTGTSIEGRRSCAVQLASRYMKKYYPVWFQRFGENVKSRKYLAYAQMRWYRNQERGLSDPENYYDQTPEEILKDLYGE